ncbi:MAG TPA: hypothetical protein VGD66_03755 [Allosphingosinicella sp.]
MNAATKPREFWRSRLYVPNYWIREAARYAHLSPQTVASWHKPSTSNTRGTLSSKDKGAALSYLQLIEVAVVARFRKAGVSLQKIRAAREYVSKQLEAEHPFAEYRFKTDGRDLWMDYAQIEAEMGDKKLLAASQGGQLAWSDIIGKLKEFDYEDDRLAVRWHVAGVDRSIIIDPQIQFGAPAVEGVPTWVFKGRWSAGEELDDIADDFGLPSAAVIDALQFEGIELKGGRDSRH